MSGDGRNTAGESLPTLLQQPCYNPADAGRLVDAAPATIRRWLLGYRYVRDGRSTRQPPLVSRSGGASTRYASFLELVDLLFVRRFLNAGVTLQTLRKALHEASEILGATHFAGRRFLTDGRGVLLELATRNDADAILHLMTGGQWTIAPVVRRLAERIDFDETSDLACRWYPAGRKGGVVLDPARSFGRPTLVGRNVTTSGIFDFYLAEGRSVQAACDWWCLEAEEVEAAVEFESGIAA